MPEEPLPQSPIVHRQPGTGEIVSIEIRIDQIDPGGLTTHFVADGYELLVARQTDQTDLSDVASTNHIGPIDAPAPEASVTQLIPRQAEPPVVEAAPEATQYALASPQAVAAFQDSHSPSKRHTGHVHAAWVLPSGSLSSVHSTRRITPLRGARKAPDGLLGRVTCSYCRKALHKAHLLPPDRSVVVL